MPVQKKKNKKGFEGLPFPLRLLNHFKDQNGDLSDKWVLGFHGLEVLNALVLFPAINPSHTSEKETQNPNEVTQDHLSIYSLNTESPSRSFTLEMDKMYIWPELVSLQRQAVETWGLLFKIPDIFLTLSNRDYDPPKTKTMIAEDKLYFNLFFDNDCNLIYFKQPYSLRQDSNRPPYITQAKGIRWAKQRRFNKSFRAGGGEKDILRLDTDLWLTEGWLTEKSEE